MVQCKYRKIGIPIKHIWFQNSKEKSRSKDTYKGVIFYHGVKDVDDDTSTIIKNKQYSLITDLSEDELFGKIGKNFRYQIRRAQKEDIECCFYSSQDLKNSQSILDSFESTYNKMYKDKKINATFNRKLVERYIQENAICITVGFYEDTPYVFHSYIVDMEDKQVRLLHSCSSFRSEKLLANLIGRINKLLHWEDMIYFKECGIRQYDWGGFLI